MTKYLSTVNVFFLLLTAFYTQFAASGELVKKDYLNTYEMPVVIKVPYYEKGAREPVEIELTLQPGDLYKSRSGKNGLVYEKYGIIEKTFAEFIKKERPTPVVNCRDGRERENKEYEKHLEELKSEKMPKDWVELYREEIPRKLDYFERTIKNYLEWQAKGSYVERELKKARSDLAFYQSIRHRTDDLEDPASDPDQDGLDNRTEYARGTHPLLKDYVSAYPKYYEVVYDHSPVVTGTFYLVNTFNKSVTVDWDNLLSRFSDFYKLNISINGQPAPEIINLPPASTNRLDCFFNAEAFPRFFDEAYKIDFFDITNEFDNAHFSVRFHTYEDNSRPLISPKIVKPENGSLFSCNDEIAFSWEEPEGKAMKKDRNERMHYKLQFIDPFGVKGERDVSKSGNAFVKRHQNFKANELEPGTYFWRANKQDRFHAPVSSDWGWLAIGREIAPEKPKGKGSDQACVQGHNGAEVVFATVGKKYDLPIQMRSNLNSHFLKSLLENQEVFFQSNGAYNPNCFHIKGVFEKAGVHTNIWLNINSKGETNEVTFIFLVHNPSEEKNVRSFYHLLDKTIVHELFVNVPFEYKERKFFEAFSKKDDLIWDENLKMEFSEALPEGLSVNLIEKGEDLEVKGIPLTAGIFKIDLVFSNGTRQLEERHVFKIKDIGEPPFEFEKKIYIPRKKKKLTDFQLVEGKNIVMHYSYVGIDFKYPIYCETYPRYKWFDDYWRFARDVNIEVIGDPAPGLKTGGIPFCTNYFTKAETTALGFFGKPTQAGKFTNMVVLVEKDIVITNKHIFVIKKDLD